MIGIILAMEKEAKEIINNISNCKEITIAKRKYYIGKFNKKKIVLAICGIGKVNASSVAQILINKFNPSCIFNIGTCGGFTPELEIGKCYEVNRCYQYDFDLSQIDNVETGYMQDFGFKFFNINTLLNEDCFTLATTDSFTISEDSIKDTINTGADLRDMEGCAIAQVCNLNNTPCYIQKVVSDVVFLEQDIKDLYYKNVTSCASIILDSLSYFLKNI